MLLLLVVLVVISGLFLYKQTDDSFHHDADIVRIEDVLYWTELIEEYQDKTGKYPLQEKVSGPEEMILVRVATRLQQKYFDKTSESYIPGLDNNRNGTFEELPVAELVAELEEGLGRDIDEHYDVQKAPTGSPIWYNYFVSDDGYLFWVTCPTCEISWATTLLGDGYTPTINIGSSGITDGARKLHTRGEMLQLPEFIELTERQFKKEEYIRQLQAQYFDDSKQ